MEIPMISLCRRGQFHKPPQEHVEHCRMKGARELHPCRRTVRPADARTQRFELRETGNGTIADFAGLEHFYPAAVDGNVLEPHPEAETAHAAHQRLGCNCLAAEAAALDPWIKNVAGLELGCRLAGEIGLHLFGYDLAGPGPGAVADLEQSALGGSINHMHCCTPFSWDPP